VSRESRHGTHECVRHVGRHDFGMVIRNKSHIGELSHRSLIDLYFSMKGSMLCSVSSRAWPLQHFLRFARGTTATPSSSAVTISPALTRTPAP